MEPIRIIHGPKTKLDRPERISIDPVNNLLAVTTVPGVLIFDRTANGDVAPKWIIQGPNTGIGGEGNSLATPLLSPEGKKIIVAGGTRATTTANGSTVANRGGIIGVWNYGESGDIAPWAILHSTPLTQFRGAISIALNPDNKDLIAISGGRILSYHMPELFKVTQ